MKWIKIYKRLCLLFVAVCSLLFTTSLSADTVHTDRGMEVIAHIEASPTETTQPATESSSRVVHDNGSVSTGETISACVIISLFLLIISALVICCCRKKISTTAFAVANNMAISKK